MGLTSCLYTFKEQRLHVIIEGAKCWIRDEDVLALFNISFNDIAHFLQQDDVKVFAWKKQYKYISEYAFVLIVRSIQSFDMAEFNSWFNDIVLPDMRGKMAFVMGRRALTSRERKLIFGNFNCLVSQLNNLMGNCTNSRLDAVLKKVYQLEDSFKALYPEDGVKEDQEG